LSLRAAVCEVVFLNCFFLFYFIFYFIFSRRKEETERASGEGGTSIGEVHSLPSAATAVLSAAVAEVTQQAEPKDEDRDKRKIECVDCE